LGVSFVSVSDDGPAFLRRSVTPSSRNTRARADGDTRCGFRAAISRAIVEAHADIWVEDKTGKGARFCFTLPLGNPGNAGVEETVTGKA
jgi:signal transduction histidine kinase